MTYTAWGAFMKNKFIFTYLLVFSLILCALPVHAARKPIDKIERENIKVTWVSGDVTIKKDGKIIPLKSTQAGIPTGYGPPQSYYDAMRNTAMDGTGNWDITTGPNSSVTFFLCNDSLGNQTGKTFIVLEANSAVKISITPKPKMFGADETQGIVTRTKGSLIEDTDIKHLQTFTAVWNVMTAINTGAVKWTVDQARSKAPNASKDQLASALIAANSARAAGASALTGIGGPLTIALEAANIVAQWVFQTETAYALAYLYLGSDKMPNKEKFNQHLLFILGGPSSVAEAVASAAQELGGKAQDYIVEKKTGIDNSVTAQLLNSPSFQKIQAKVMKKLTDRFGEEFAKKVAKAAGKVVPIASVVWGAASAAIDAARFGGEVKEFYQAMVTVQPQPQTQPAQAKPEGVTAKALSANSIQVSWKAVPGAAKYRVYANKGMASDAQPLSGFVTGTSYTHTGLQSDSTYYYFVSAVNNAGQESERSANTGQNNAATLKPPAVPTGVTAASVSASSVKVSWNAVSGATKYKVFFAKHSPTSNITQAGEVSGTSYTHNGLESAAYYYYISAVNSAGESARSQLATVTPTAPLKKPAAPTGVTAKALSTNSIQVGWNAVSGATKYRVCSASGAQLDEVTGTSYTHNGLTQDTRYQYKVLAINNAGESAFSVTASATTQKAAAPAVTQQTKRSRGENQQIIQNRCKFGNANDVWAAINKHSSADSLYDKWAGSYPSGYLSSRPRTLDTNGYKAYIQEQCKFSNANDVWRVIEQNHKFAADVFKVWAASYYERR